MWPYTKATDLLGISYPILQGPMGGGFSTVALAAAVSNAGGLGGYGAVLHSAEEIYTVDRQLKAATDKPYNINLWVSDTDAGHEGTVSDAHYEQAKQLFKPYFDEAGLPLPEKPRPFKSLFENQVQVILDVRPKVFSFIYGIPSADILEQCRRLGIRTVGAATTVDEAVALENAGVDMIVAAGFEAGGHRPYFLEPVEQSGIGTFVLLQLMREKVKIPVVAAGGIANGRGIAAACMLGASAVQIGTAFLACNESGALAAHRQILFSEAAKYTILSRIFTGRQARAVTTRVAKDIEGKGKKLLPFPLQAMFYSTLHNAALRQQQHDMAICWSGQIAPALKHTSAAVLMQSLIDETAVLLKS